MCAWEGRDCLIECNRIGRAGADIQVTSIESHRHFQVERSIHYSVLIRSIPFISTDADAWMVSPTGMARPYIIMSHKITFFIFQNHPWVGIRRHRRHLTPKDKRLLNFVLFFSAVYPACCSSGPQARQSKTSPGAPEQQRISKLNLSKPVIRPPPLYVHILHHSPKILHLSHVLRDAITSLSNPPLPSSCSFILEWESSRLTCLPE